MPIKHVVVVLFENRSYDNVLGWLYHPDNPAPYQKAPPGQAALDGLTGDESNPDPGNHGQTIPVANQTTPTQSGGEGPAYAPTAIPIIDPGELFKDMAQQFTGSTTPPKSNPYVDYPPENTSALTQGYTLNYAGLTTDLGLKKRVPGTNVRDVMNYLTPAQMPVTAYLARNYAVCDRWYASAPTQTYPNRAFALCAAPGIDKDGKFSLIEDWQYYVHGLKNTPSILSQLESVLGTNDGVPAWKVYFHDYCIAAETVPLVADAAKSGENVNVATFDDADWGTETPKPVASATTTFVEDLTAGNLPPFSFIEPRYFDNYASTDLPPTSNHPGQGKFPGDLLPKPAAKAPIDAATGEVFLMQLYNLLHASPSWDETLLIVTYDEHGGIYDHCAPPLATPPGDSVPPVVDLGDSAAEGFGYNVLGGRVPALIVSPRIAAGTTIRPDPSDTTTSAFDHSSIVRTVWDIFSLTTAERTSLNRRDLYAPSLVPFLTGTPDNQALPFSGTIVAGPGALAFSHSRIVPGQPDPQKILASAGPDAVLQASASQPWLSASIDTGASPLVSIITVNVDVSGLRTGTYNGAIVISGDAANSPLSIPVTLTIDLL